MSPQPPLRRTALGATALLAVTMTTAAVAAPAGADGATAGHSRTLNAAVRPSTAAPSTARVTLVTGDRVTVSRLADGRTATSITPARGNTDPIQTTTIGDHTFVLPQSAMPYLAAGLIDRDLFDVTGLIAQGYDDAHQRTLPLIVQYADGVAPSTPDGAVRRDTLTSIHAAALAAPRTRAATFWTSVTAGTQARPRLADGITKLWLDGQVKADLVDSTAQVGAPQAWADGFNGTGATVAVLDTGIDATHPDVKDQIVASQSFVPDEDTSDVFGHGTHVSSTIAGTGAASGGDEKGVAWGAHLAVGKVLADDGFGQESWIIAGMEWAADQAPVVNMSLSTSEISDGSDPISQAVDDLSQAKGTLFVVSAGNAGCEGCFGAPAAADDALTVGAVDGTDQLTWFSSMGPRVGDAGIKPELTAPGVDILAARSSQSAGEGDYTLMSGTSMSAPHVAGAAAILAQRHPAWTGAQIKDALVSSAHALEGFTPYQVGTGRLDIPAALGDVHATGALTFGFYPWPHTADQPATRTVTYRNDGADPVTLDLAADVRDAGGTPAANGAVTLSTDQVTVPAGGTASVDLTGDPTLVAPGTRLSGVLVASADGTPVTRTALGMEVEAERYDLRVQVTGRDGQPAQTFVIVHEKNDDGFGVYDVTGESTLRLPPGTYSVTSFMEVSDAPGATGIALVGDPEVVLDSARSVDLNAQEADRVTVKSPRRGAVASWRQLEWHVSAGIGMTDGTLLTDLDDAMYAQPTDAVTQGSYSFVSRWRLRRNYVSVRVGTRTLDTLMAIDSGWVHKDGATITLAYAGTGTPTEFDDADVQGKIAVVSLDTDTNDLSSYTTAAASRGAKALVVINHQPGRFIGLAGPTFGVQATIPVATVPGKEGAWLVPQAQAGAAATLGGGVNSPYVYDLMHEIKGHIPASIVYAPKQADLARIDARFLSYRTRIGGESRCHFASYSHSCFSLAQLIQFPSTRVDYVSTEPGTRWLQGAFTLEGMWDVRGDVKRYHAGQHAHEDWFGPVVAPRLGAGYFGPGRQSTFFDINLPSWGDSAPGHTGGMDPALTDQRIRLYRGPHLIKASRGFQSLSTFEPSPSKRLKYRVTNDATRSAFSYGTSTSSHTEWTFWSHAASANVFEDLLPFISLTYRIHTDVRGQAPAGHRVRVGFDAYHQDGAVDAGRITGGRLRVSYDNGRTWQRVALTGKAGHWVGHLQLPRTTSRTVSLRGAAWDSHGNTVAQKVVRAVLLR